jgi:hypothetical protein
MFLHSAPLSRKHSLNNALYHSLPAMSMVSVLVVDIWPHEDENDRLTVDNEVRLACLSKTDATGLCLLYFVSKLI